MCRSLRDNGNDDPDELDIAQLQQLSDPEVLAAAINAQQQRQRMIMQQPQIKQPQQHQQEQQQTGPHQRVLCLNCNLIQMGSAVSYADGSCPQCGNAT